jgi:hypothetical protein
MTTRLSILSRTLSLGVACLFALGAHAAITSNGLTNNALTNNALTNNALTNNAITANALTNNGLHVNGLHVNGLAPSAGQAGLESVAPVAQPGAYAPSRSWPVGDVRVHGSAAAR